MSKKMNKRRKRKRVLLIDGNNVCAKFTHVFRNVTTPDGATVGALYGVVTFLRNFISNHSFDSIVFVTDDRIPSFRRRVCPEYKVSREHEREHNAEKKEFFECYHRQLKLIPKILRPLGVHFAKAVGYEADDAIAAFVYWRYASFDNVIMSEDKDLIQLVGDNCIQYRTSTKSFVRERCCGYVIERAMIGDPSDGLSGVKSIGKVRARRIIEDCASDSVDEFAEMLCSSDKYEKLVLDNLDVVRNNVRVMDLRRTARKANKKIVMKRSVPDKHKFIKVCKKYSFHSFLESPTFFFKPFERASSFFEGSL